MAEERDLLADLLRLQDEIRAIEAEDQALDLTDPDGFQFHQNTNTTSTTNKDTPNSEYVPTAPTSVPEGTVILQAPAADPGDIKWADTKRSAEGTGGTGGFAPPEGCANGTNCLDENFCYSWFDCEPCQWCENFQCAERDPYRPCSASWECPCAPTEEQDYACIDDRCALSCTENADCPTAEVCDPRDFRCKPGCQSDEECKPGSANAAPDARTGSFCLNSECVTPCEPPLLCDGPNDFTTCGPNEYCADKKGRAPGDPPGALYSCQSGCVKDDQCTPDVYTRYVDEDDEGTDVEFPRTCIDNKCSRSCNKDSQCATEFGEACVQNECKNIGLICVTQGDCEEGQFCNSDGRCESGCDSNDDCRKTCKKDAECVDACPPDPTCTCEECDPNDNSWLQLCPRDPACVAACPKDADCMASYDPNATCVDNKCVSTCDDSNDCRTGFACLDGECTWIDAGGETEICDQETVCVELDNGDTECEVIETCQFVSPKIDDNFFGCDCGEVCTQGGQCATTSCQADGDCESCSYCKGGICVEGCNDDNPCPPGEVCTPESKCATACETDADCTAPEVCLSAGYCGLACEPTIPCRGSFDCPDFMYCEADTETCEDGCRKDGDCGDGFTCWQQNCEQICNSDSDCDGDECGPNGFCIARVDTCQNDDDCSGSSVCLGGTCKGGCRRDSDCGDGESCTDNRCEFLCTSDDQCKATERGNKCERSTKAAEEAQSRIARLEDLKDRGETISASDLARLKEIAQQKNATGYCRDLGGGEGIDSLQDGCSEFERCDELGQCQEIPCAGDADCPSGQCLTDGFCGYCTRNADCTDGRFCEFAEEGDTFGTCVYRCIPEDPCETDTDCPSGAFCNTRLGLCEVGCRADDDCLPGQGCRGGNCLKKCDGASDCIEDDGFKCLSGLCEFIGFKCSDDGDCPPERGWCNGGSCTEDLRCSGDSDCVRDEICDSGICTQGARCNKGSDCLKSCDGNRDCSKSCLLDSDCGDKFIDDPNCPEGESCDQILSSSGRCVGVGDGGAPGYCQGGTDGDTCSGGRCQNDNPQLGRYCNQFTGLCQPGWSCDSDDDCTFPDICHQGECRFERRCSSDTQCQANEYCSKRAGNICKVDDRCGKDEDCALGYVCGAKGVCIEDFQAGGEAQASTCDCGQVCNPITFSCKDQICITDEDCECGFCSAGGICKEACSSSNDCAPGFYCSSDKICESIDSIPCKTGADCPAGYVCPDGGGYCQKPCTSDQDCDGGYCVNGFCEGAGACRTDADCEKGFCISDRDGNFCAECRNNGDCSAAYGDDAFECIDNQCATPCYTSLSTGSCFDGLNYGDTCQNCRDKCPEGSSCVTTENVCDVTYRFDSNLGREVAVPIFCIECVAPCSSDKSCKGESTCEGGFCEAFDGRCTSSLDCERALNKPDLWDVPWEDSNQPCDPESDDPALSGCPAGEYCDGGSCRAPAGTLAPYEDRAYTCFENTCELVDLFCIGTSDCPAGDMCDENGYCITAECLTDDECQTGKVCVDRACRWECGGAVDPFTCADPSGPYDPEIPCPPNFNCNTGTNLCTRDGYSGVESVMGCPTGEYCYERRSSSFGTCLRNEDCNENAATGPNKCFGDGTCGAPQGSGACLPIKDGVSECRTDQHCRDRSAPEGYSWKCEEGLCKQRRDDYDGTSRGPSALPSPGEQGDDVEDTCTRLGKCCGADGFCIDCGCDEEHPCPDGQCCDGSGLCVDITAHPSTKWGAPASCSFDPVFCQLLGPAGDDGNRSVVDPTSYQGRGYSGCETVYNADGTTELNCWEGGPLKPSQITALLVQDCTPSEADEKDDCSCPDDLPSGDECQTTEDCGGCGQCVAKTWKGDACCPLADADGRDQVTYNICQSEKECPEAACFSDDDCTECEACVGAQFRDSGNTPGRCQAKCEEKCPCGGQLSGSGKCPTCEDTYGDCVESFTPDLTGSDADETPACGCRVKTENPCCATFVYVEDTLKRRDGCEFIKSEDQDGTVTISQVDYCSDFDAGICAQCTQDSHCKGNSVCRGYKCVTQCGDEDAVQDSVGNCACCTDDGQCKEIYESWSDSREAGGGMGYTETKGQSRPCTCTEKGIECGPYVDAESCYQWVQTDGGSGENAEADRMKMNDDLERMKEDVQTAQEAYNDTQYELSSAAVRRDAAIAAQEEACGTEETPACTQAKEKQEEAQDEVTAATNTIQDLTADITEADINISNLKSRLAVVEATIDNECTVNPSGAPCQSAISEQESLNNSITVAEEQRAALVIQKDQVTLVLEDAQASLEFWNTEVNEQCGEQTAECTSATAEFNAADSAYQTALANGNSALITLENARAAVVAQENALSESPYRRPTFTQQRKCSCCIDGQCRPESDCTFGTCYLCATEESLTQGDHYRAQLYTQVLGTETCTGCTNLAGERWSNKNCPEDATGESAVYFEIANECVKYKCEDGINTIQELCSGDQTSWYDYCFGSILGCLFSENREPERINYWNGYEFNIYCPLAGVWAFNAESDPPRSSPDPTFGLITPNGGGNWVRLTQNKQNSSSSGGATYKSKCAYPNPLGHIQGNWLPTFEGTTQIHKCCASSDVYHECDPDHPDCSLKLEFLFEPGDPTLVIDRLGAQIEAIERYLKDLDDVKGQLDDLKQAKETEKANIETALENAGKNEEELVDLVAYWESEITRLTGELSEAEGAIDEAQEAYDEAEATRDEKAEEKNTAIEARDEILEQQGPLGEEKIQVEANLESAKGALATAAGQVTTLSEQILTIQKLQIELGCICPTDDDGNQLDPECEESNDIQCFEFENDLIELNDQLTDAQNLVDQLTGDIEDLDARLVEIGEELGPLDDELNEAQSEVDRLTGEWQTATAVLGDAGADLDAAKGEVTRLRGELNNANKQFKTFSDLLAGVQDPDQGKIQDLEAELENVNTVLENIQESYTIIADEKAEYTDLKYEKEEEKKRLEEEQEVPVIPEASSRPDEGKTMEDLKEQYDEAQEEIKEKEEDPWYPES